VALHRLLATSPAALVTTTLEDLAGMLERPNMPGTIDEWPNWRWGLPHPLEAVLADDEARAIRTVLADR
jgi:4-alpha-glucanotransferase